METIQQILSILESKVVDELEYVLIYYETSEPAKVDLKGKIIYLSKELCQLDRVIYLSHEIGHILDLNYRFNGDFERFHVVSINNSLEVELEAWNLSENLLHSNGFENWDLFNQSKVKFLKTYA